MTFKKGDRVVCIKPISDASRAYNLEEGVVYTVGQDQEGPGSCILLTQTSLYYSPSRFEPYPRNSAGLKLDDGKLPLQLLDPAALEGAAKVLQFGAKKYAPNNWRKGLAYMCVLGATLRHIFAFMRGEDNDPETGLSHIDHAQCELMFLSSYIKSNRTDLDDRIKS